MREGEREGETGKESGRELENSLSVTKVKTEMIESYMRVKQDDYFRLKVLTWIKRE